MLLALAIAIPTLGLTIAYFRLRWRHETDEAAS